ncbi:MAG: beta-L-arabinofuranosidase domain-containing protein [Candidatus Acidiferrum sp.]
MESKRRDIPVTKRGSNIDRRTFLTQGTLVGVAALNLWPERLWADEVPPDYSLAQLPLRDVEVTDTFWSPRIEKARAVSLPMMLDREQHTKWIDSRLIEGAAYFLEKRPDAALDRQAQSLFAPLSAAMKAQMGSWPSRGDGPFLGTGHFFEAAMAYHQATGNPQLLNIAIEVANDLNHVYGPGKRTDISNHEGIELALVKLYYATGDYKYVQLAKFIVDMRGTTAGGRQMVGPYAQDEQPVVEQRRAIGHCVRATYLYCAVTDLGAVLPEGAYRGAALRIWDDAVSKRTYVTGGIGSYRREENYGDDYDLPNVSCWNEICAAVGNTLWNRRMLQLTRDSRYADMMERILYNGLLAGVSLEGDTFLYQAPLKTYVGFTRQPRYGPNCCPPNITRLLAQLGTLIYSRDKQNLYVNLLIGSQARLEMGGRQVSIEQETKYPWDGLTRIKVDPSDPTRFAINVRIPGWAQGEPQPGKLYRYEDASVKPFSLVVNGKEEAHRMNQGYAEIEREWSRGDVIELSLPMVVRTVRADERVIENKGMVALERGPLVFCAEALDNSGGVFNLVVPDSAKLQFSYQAGLFEGVGTIHGEVQRLSRNGERTEIKMDTAELTAIPYYAFANRGSTEMAVWLARDPGKAVTVPSPTIASTSVATSSCGNGSFADNYPGHTPPTPAERMYPTSQDGSGHISAISDQLAPVGSEDGSSPFLRLRPQSGNQAWVQYDFQYATEVSSVSVFWKDDRQFCVAPAKWKLLYREGDQWQPVKAAGEFAVEKDKFNKTEFAAVRTSGLRMEIELSGKVYKKGELGPPDANYLKEAVTWYEGGVIEWVVGA